ncbi:MAG: 50S ribosomal protein L35 [Armatimonadetes bacterium]|nr:50S ribosomal protein L35 [Armatimonadota bacterium]
MPKIKTNKTAAKRFKVTATGKILHGHTKLNHLMRKKTPSGQRRLTIEGQVTGGDLKKIKRLMPG